MSSTLTAPPATRSTPARTAPALPALVGIEARKSLSTRSGKALALTGLLLGPAGIVLVTSLSDTHGAVSAAGVLSATGTLGALVLLALGVLSTAGEWTHRTVQTTFLLVPRRGRVLAAKVAAVAVLGAVSAGIAVGGSIAAVAVSAPEIVWTGIGRAVLVVVVCGAVFAVLGAGIGAALGNSPAALTGSYVLMLAVLPVLALFRPTLAHALSPSDAMVSLAQGQAATTPVLTLTGWLVVTVVAGFVVTRRRAVA